MVKLNDNGNGNNKGHGRKDIQPREPRKKPGGSFVTAAEWDKRAEREFRKNIPRFAPDPPYEKWWEEQLEKRARGTEKGNER